MKLKLDTATFKAGLQLVCSAAPSKGVLPVLCNVLLDAAEERLVLTATDLEITASTVIDAEVEEPGVATLPARRLAQIVGLQEGETITLDTDETCSTRISCGSAQYKIMGLAPEEFPRTGEIDAAEFRLDPLDLVRALAAVQHAASKDGTRYVLNGVHVVSDGQQLTVTATDGRRLARAEVSLEGVYAVPAFAFILPMRAVAELIKHAGGEHLYVKRSDARASFQFGKTTITTKLVEGAFPKTEQVIPTDLPHVLQLPACFASALSRVATIVKDSAAGVKIRLSEDQLAIHAHASDIGEADEVVAIDCAVALAFSVNPAYLLQAIDSATDDEDSPVQLNMATELKPLTVTAPGFLEVVMPLRS